MAGLFTIGYEGAPLTALVTELKQAGVGVLADIRDHPWSRRPELCRKPLAAALAAEGIAYLHLKALGNPREGREAARGGDAAGYRAVMAAQLSSAVAAEALALVAREAQSRGIALMCLEKDPARCHRAIVAAALTERFGLAVRHLHPGGQLALF